MRRAAIVLAPALVALVASAAPVAGREAGELLVSAAISLEPALRELTDGFEVVFNTGGSAVLMQQVRRGAPVDVFVSASPAELDRLEREGRIEADTRRTIASNTLVVVVPRGTPVPEDVMALARPEYGRIACGNPRTAPLGRYTHAALDALGLLPHVERRLVFGENARQVLDWVARGEAVGITYRTDAALLPERVTTGPAVPASAFPAIRYEAAVVADSGNPRAARAFIDRLTSDVGRSVLVRHGFSLPR